MLSCSWCGPRPEAEFDLLGAENPAGGEWSIERWWHRTGCGRPVVLARNLMTGDAFALQPAVVPLAGPQDVPVPPPAESPPEVEVALASPSAPAATAEAPAAATAPGAAGSEDTGPAPAADRQGAEDPSAEVGVGVGVADALTVTRTPVGDVIGYRWSPRGSTGNGATPAIFSFNWIGVPVHLAPPEEADADEADAAPDPTDAAVDELDAEPTTGRPGSDGLEPGEPEGQIEQLDEPTAAEPADDQPSDGDLADDAPSWAGASVDEEPDESASVDEAPLESASVDEEPDESASADDWTDDELVLEEGAAAEARFRGPRRRSSVQQVRRPTARPVPGWGQSTPAAQEVDMTRRAPVAVVPRRPEAPGAPAAPDEVGSS